MQVWNHGCMKLCNTYNKTYITFNQYCFIFCFFFPGPDPSELADTAVKFGLTKIISKVQWSFTAVLASESSVSLTISSPPNAPIGLYQLTLEQVSKEATEVSLGQFVLLFNPWCKSKISWLLYWNYLS